MTTVSRPIRSNCAPAEDADLFLQLERRELADLLGRAMALLPAETREALVASYLDEMPQDELAARLGLRAGALRARLHRGRQMLRRVLEDDLRADALTWGLLADAGAAMAGDAHLVSLLWHPPSVLSDRPRTRRIQVSLRGRVPARDRRYRRWRAARCDGDAYQPQSALESPLCGVRRSLPGYVDWRAAKLPGMWRAWARCLLAARRRGSRAHPGLRHRRHLPALWRHR